MIAENFFFSQLLVSCNRAAAQLHQLHHKATCTHVPIFASDPNCACLVCLSFCYQTCGADHLYYGNVSVRYVMWFCDVLSGM